MAFKTLASDEALSDKALVVDNSVMMRWLFKDGSEADRAYAQQVLTDINQKRPPVVVPYVWVYEASFVVNHYASKDLITCEEAKNRLDSLFDLCTVIRGEEEPSVLFEFANTYGLSSYDAAYAMLAEGLHCRLATLDKQLATATKKIGLKLF